MPCTIIVAYATRNGSTGEVAEAIGVALREAGLQVQVARARELPSVAGCTAIVLGAPLYMGGLPREMHRFLTRNRAVLAGVRPWFFVLGPVHDDPKEFVEARKQAVKQLVRYPWLKPAELQIFGGRFDVKRMGFPFSLARHLPAFPAKDIPATDARDWDAIRSWAEGIARQLRPAA